MKNIFVSLMLFAVLAVTACDDRPFVTAVDLPLQVIALSPADGSVAVARDAVVQARFNLDLVKAARQAAVYLLSY